MLDVYDGHNYVGPGREEERFQIVPMKICSSSYKNLLHWVKFLLINPWDYEISGAGVISLRPLQIQVSWSLPNSIFP